MADNNTTQKEYVLKLTAKTEDFTRKLDEASGKLKEAGQTAEKYKQQMEKAGNLRGAGLADTITQLGKVSSEYNHVTSRLSEAITQAKRYDMEMSSLSEKQRKNGQEVADSSKRYETLAQVLAEAKQKHAAMTEALGRLKGDEAYQRLSASADELNEAIARTTEKLTAQREELAKTEQLLASQEEAMRQYADEQAERDEKVAEATTKREQALQRLAKVQAEVRMMEYAAKGGDPVELFGERYANAQRMVEGWKMAIGGWEDALAHIGLATENASRGQAELGAQMEVTRGKAEEQRSSVSALEGVLRGQQLSLEDLAAQQEAVRRSAGVDFSDGEYEQLTLQIEEATSVLKGAGGALKETGGVLEEQAAKAAEAGTETAALGTTFEESTAKAQTFAEGLGTAETESEALSQTLSDGVGQNELYADVLARTAQELEHAGSVAEKYKQQVAEVNAFKGSSGLKQMASDLSALTKDYQSQASQLEKAEIKMQKYGSRMQDLTFKYGQQQDAIALTKSQITDFEGRLENIRQAADRLKNSGLPVDYGKMLAASQPRIQALETFLAGLREELKEQQREAAKTESQIDALGDKFADAAFDVDRMRGSMAATEGNMAALSGAMQTQLASESLSRRITALGEALASAGKAAAGRFVKGIKTAAKWLKTMGDRAAKAAKESKLLNGMSTKLGRAINGLGSMARRLLARLALRAIFQDIGNAMKALAKQFDDFNQTMNGLGSGTKQLVAQMAAAFGSLIQQLAPILNQILDMLVNFFNTITQMFAVLGGSGTWRRAVRGAYDFSGAMDNAAGSAGGAADAQEELNRQLLGFDQINKLNEAKDSTGGGGGGGGAGSDDDGAGAFQWVEEEVPKTKLTEWVDKLRKAFEDHDWPGIGKTFADGINQAFSWIQDATSWENVGDKVSGFIHDFSDGFNSFIENISTHDIGATIGGAVTSLLNSITELEDSINWDEVGKKLGEGINGLAEKLDLSKASEAFAKKFNLIFDVVGNFADTTDWDKLGKDIAGALNKLLNTLDVADIVSSASQLVTGLITTLATAIGEANWDEVGEKIGEALRNIDWKGLLESLGTLIKETLVGAFELLSSTIVNILGGDEVSDAINGVTKDIEEQNEKLREGIGLYGRYAEISIVTEKYKDSLKNEQQAFENMNTALDNLNEKRKAYEEAENNKPDTRFMTPEQMSSAWDNYYKELRDAGRDLKVAEDAYNDAQKAYQDAASTSRQYADELYLAQNDYDDLSQPRNKEKPTQSYVHGADTVEEIREEQDEYTPSTITVGQRPSQPPKQTTPYVHGSDTVEGIRAEQDQNKPSKLNLPVLNDKTPYYVDEGGVKTTIKANKQLEKSTSSYASALDGTVGTAKRAEKASTSYANIKGVELKTITRVTDGLVGANDRAERSTKTAAVRMSSSWSGAATSINYSVKPLTTQIPSLFEQAMRNSETKMKGAEKGLTSTATRISTSVGATVKDSLKAAFAIDLTETGAKAGKSYAEGLKNSDFKTPSIVERVKSGLNFDLSGTGYTVGKSYGLALKDAIESTKIKTPQIVSRGSHTLSGTNVSAPRYAIEWYAQGGFPDVGQLFMSRENGPEMVGQIGGHTAVANNDQIVAAVSAGVARAVGSVLSQNMSRDEQGGDLVVRIDSEEIYRAALKGQRKVNKRTNPVFATI